MSEIDKARAAIRAQQEKLVKLDEFLLFLSCLDESQKRIVRDALNDDTATENTFPEVASVYKPSSQTKATGGLETAMLAVIESMREITAPAIVLSLVNSGYVFGSENHLASVNQVLRKWKKNGFVIETEAGSGRRPSKYRKQVEVEESQAALSLAS